MRRKMPPIISPDPGPFPLFSAFYGRAVCRYCIDEKIAPHQLLFIYALINCLLCVLVIRGVGWISVYGLMTIFFFMSTMFPTIFALGVKDLDHLTKKGSSFIIMAIAGGALMPYIMGRLAESSTAHAYIIPMFCFLIVAWFGWKGFKTK